MLIKASTKREDMQLTKIFKEVQRNPHSNGENYFKDDSLTTMRSLQSQEERICSSPRIPKTANTSLTATSTGTAAVTERIHVV